MIQWNSALASEGGPSLKATEKAPTRGLFNVIALIRQRRSRLALAFAIS